MVAMRYSWHTGLEAQATEEIDEPPVEEIGTRRLVKEPMTPSAFQPPSGI